MAKNDTKIIKGGSLNNNAGQAQKYKKLLMSFVKPMTAQTQREILALYSEEEFLDYISTVQLDQLLDRLTERWTSIFDKVSPVLARTFVDESKKISEKALEKSLKKMGEHLQIKTGMVPKELEAKLAAVVSENVGLIKSIPQQYMADVRGDVMRSVTTGEGIKSLKSDLIEHAGVSERRAKNIALDQTRKTYNMINAARIQAVGIAKFMWVHSGGGQRPRKEHVEMDGNIYEYDNLPIIDSKTGERGLPGQLINCGCTQTPIFEFSED